MKKSILLIFLSICTLGLMAQEMNFSITINTPKLQTVDPAVFVELRTNLENFLNTQKWTNDVYDPEERIAVNVQMTITEEVSPTSFKANMQIQALRPIYGSSESTLLLSHNDKDISFVYEPLQPLEYSQNIFNDNLTAIFSFYVYYILGLDYDTFSPFGGEPHFQTAQNIINTIPPEAASNFKGWRSLDGNRNRYWMVESMLNPKVRPFRRGLYDYHRQGLDLMSEDPATGRAIIAQVMDAIGEVNRDYPNAMSLQMFANAKSSEIIEIFIKGNSAEKSKARSVMSRLDAANASKYRKIGS